MNLSSVSQTGMCDLGSEIVWNHMIRQSPFTECLARSSSEFLEGRMQNNCPKTSLHQPVIAPPSILHSGFETTSVMELYLQLDLGLSKHHHGKVLYGQFHKDYMQKGEDVITLLVDTNGDAICLHASKLAWLTACTGGPELRSCVGKRVFIKEPIVEMDNDGLYIIRVIDAADVVMSLDGVNTDGCSQTEASDAASVEDLHKIRLEGNHFFARENWAAAVNRYSQCIHHAVGKLDNKSLLGTISREKLNSVLMLAYTNRAESRLRLQHYEHALSDADEALKIEPNHVKTLVRKGKAAHGLGLYKESCTSFKAALKESRGERSIIECLTASRTSLEQSRTGNYDLYDYFLRFSRDPAPSCADFVGPVEIRPVSYLKGGRGLFATRDVKAGELLLVSNPLARVTPDSNGPENLIAALAKRVKTSKRHMAQVYSLAGYGKDETEVPSMKLFTPGSKWILPGAEKLEFDRGVIDDILGLNAFNVIDDTPGKVNKIGSAIWALPSFANHSCIPNMYSTTVGHPFFFRSSVDIMKGEELTISYLCDGDLLDDVERRQAQTKLGWSFTCKCVRCLLEETLRSKLSKIRKPSPSLVFNFTEHVLSARNRFRHERHLWHAAKDLAKVADEVEEAIESHDSKLRDREKGWIRATFLPAFQAKVFLAMEQGDSDSTISALKLVLDSTTSVFVDYLAVKEAAVLLEEVEKNYSQDRLCYRLTLDRVLGIYRVVYGQLPVRNLRKLIDLWISTWRRRYHAHLHTTGTNCDLTGEPRETEVRYACSDNGQLSIRSIKEAPSCKCTVVFHVPALCKHSLFQEEQPPWVLIHWNEVA